MSNKNIFNSIENVKNDRSMFDLSHDVKLSCNMGNLVPVMVLDCIPSDVISVSQESLVRLAPMVAPPMQMMNVYIHNFFVPYRLLWKGWEEFIFDKEGIIVHPTLTMPNTNVGYTPLMDYMGIPKPSQNSVATTPEPVSALQFAAYQMIYNEYYRDANLDPEIDFNLVNGTNDAHIVELCKLRQRAWGHDYFTSALPAAQTGNPVELPIAGFNNVPVKLQNDDLPANTEYQSDDTWGAIGGTPDSENPRVFNSNPLASGISADHLFIDGADLQAQNTTISDLRKAFKLQEFAERLMRGGRRFIERLRTFFDVKDLDVRLQRPEFISGTMSPITVSEVLNTTGTDDAPQGQMAGHGISVLNGSRTSYKVHEHGCIIGIMSVIPKTGYQQGLNRMWLKNTFADYFFPQFQHIGEQEIQLKELYAYTTNGTQTFGYIPRYSEYRYEPNRVAGSFRDTLNFWHLSRIFANEPQLNQTFVTVNPNDTMRIFAVTDPTEDHLWCQVMNKVKAIRPMSYFGTPSI